MWSKAAIAFGLLGPVAREAGATLGHLLTDEWHNVLEAATNAMQAIESETL